MLGAIVRELKALSCIDTWALRVDGKWHTGFHTEQQALEFYRAHVDKDHALSVKMYTANEAGIHNFQYVII